MILKASMANTKWINNNLLFEDDMTDPGKGKLIERIKEIKAADIMSKHAITIKETDSVSVAAHLIMRFKISGIPIVSRENQICGIVTATDLFMHMEKIYNNIERNRDLMIYFDIPVTTIMSKEIHTIEKELPLDEIMKVMFRKNIHTIPVLSGNKLLGIVGRRDVINACYVKAYDLFKNDEKNS